MEITGTLKVKFDTQKVSDRFQKREFVLTTEANTLYPQHVSMQVTQDKCTILDQYNVGEELKVQFNLRGREWNGPQGIKYFNTIEAWRIEKMNAATTTQTNATPPVTEAQVNNVVNNSADDKEDLPF